VALVTNKRFHRTRPLMPAELAVATSAFVTRAERPMWDLNCAKK
jgi:hypothetical protein